MRIANLQEHFLAYLSVPSSILIQCEGWGYMPKRAINQSFPVMEKMLLMNTGITFGAHPPPTALIASQ